MNFIFGTLLGLVVGILIGTLHTRNARRYWQWRLGRKLQLITARNEMKGHPFDEAPKRMMMDHDSIFLHLVHNTLPNMGIKVVRTSVGCPWQNGVAFAPGTLRAEAIPWLGGLHHSYRRVA